MADPSLPTILRTMCILQNADGLPEDRYITTWAFARAAVPFAAAADQAGVLMERFWNGSGGGRTPVATFLGSQVSRAIDACSIVSYDLSQAVPRTPHVVRFTMGAGMATEPYVGPIPAEVACCLTLTTSVRSARGRGRVYIGPFNKYALGTSEAGDATVSSTLRATLKGAATELMTGAGSGSPQLVWAMISHSDATWREVTGGWVDDAFDTQRRRGRAAVIRELWPTP